EDVSGQLDVMVWSKVFANTRELWQEGTELVIEGKVRLRDDRVQLSCDSVHLYQPEVVQSGEAVTPEPDEAPVQAEETPSITVSPKSHRLVISITQTSDKESDTANLNKLSETLKEYPGVDNVSLRVNIAETVFDLKLPSTGYCHELHQRLVTLVGEDGLRVETTA
ncbi:OB-fold nucleic acid binding domain-containing protein, partial [Chloroflexota bacterium]